jgi:hypothetical protein
LDKRREHFDRVRFVAASSMLFFAFIGVLVVFTIRTGS